MALERIQRLLIKAQIEDDSSRKYDLAETWKELMGIDTHFNRQERQKFLIAHKNVIEEKRSSWKVLSIIEQDAVGIKQEISRGKKQTLETEVKEFCEGVLTLLQAVLSSNLTPEERVFYLMMRGNYHSYLAEIALGEERDEDVNRAQTAYKEALRISREQLSAGNPTHLQMCLCFAEFMNDILGTPIEACQLAKQEWKEAKKVNRRLQTESIQLIKELHRKWKALRPSGVWGFVLECWSERFISWEEIILTTTLSIIVLIYTFSTFVENLSRSKYRSRMRTFCAIVYFNPVAEKLEELYRREEEMEELLAKVITDVFLLITSTIVLWAFLWESSSPEAKMTFEVGIYYYVLATFMVSSVRTVSNATEYIFTRLFGGK